MRSAIGSVARMVASYAAGINRASVRSAEGLNRDVFVLASLAFGNFVAMTSYSYLPLYLTTYAGLSVEASSVVVSARGCAALVACYFVGFFMDLYGPRRSMVISLLVVACANALIPATNSPALLAVFVGVWAAGRTAFRPAYNARQIAICPKSQFGRAYSVFLIATNSGLGIAALIGAQLMTLFPPALFFTDGAISVLVAIAANRIFSKHDRDEKPSRPVPVPSHRMPWQDGAFLIPCAIYFLVELAKAQALFVLPIFLTETGRIDLATWGRMLSGVNLAVLALSFGASTYLVAYRQSYVIGVAALTMCLGLAGTGLGTSTAVRIGCWALYCIGEVVFYPALMRLTMSHFRDETVGNYTSFYYSWSFLAALIGPLVAGRLYSSVGAEAVWIACACLGGGAAAIAVTRADARPSGVDRP